MKPIKNTIEIPKHLVAKRALGNYRCKFCHNPDSGIVHWEETSYGTSTLLTLAMDYSNAETEGYNDFHVVEYECGECGESACNLEDIFE